MLKNLLTRREFLRITGGVVGSGLLGIMVTPYLTRSSTPVRPPGSLPEPAFLAACIHCGRCANICDRDAIRLDSDGTPYLNGIDGWCDFCAKCVDVCPTGAILPFDAQTMVIGTAEIDRTRCIAWDHVGCRLCYDECLNLKDAIYLDENLRPYIDAERCVGCAACVNVCPQSAKEGMNRKYGKAMMVRS